MQEKGDVNVIKSLMEIGERLARIETNTQGISDTAKKAEDAYNLSKQNEEDIKNLKSNSIWWQRTMWVAIILPTGLFIVEQFILNK